MVCECAWPLKVNNGKDITNIYRMFCSSTNKYTIFLCKHSWLLKLVMHKVFRHTRWTLILHNICKHLWDKHRSYSSSERHHSKQCVVRYFATNSVSFRPVYCIQMQTILFSHRWVHLDIYNARVIAQRRIVADVQFRLLDLITDKLTYCTVHI